ncbi:MAG: nucleotide exchange factor GrpE, partial [Saprospiraceae bacterium]
KYLRLFAEFDNFRKRTAREKLELRQTAAKDTLSALLPLIDDFARAKKEHENDASEEHFTEGVQLLYDKLQSFMTKQKLEPVDATGEVFDADFHEAITEIPAPTEEMKGKVIDTIERGYKLNDKIIRYARVVVGK